jgi:hypothetical protein
MSYQYIEVTNKSGISKIVEDLSDDLFNEGYRFIRYVPNSEVDIYELDAQREEDTLLKMAGSSNDPCYWLNDDMESSDSYFSAPLEIY